MHAALLLNVMLPFSVGALWRSSQHVATAPKASQVEKQRGHTVISTLFKSIEDVARLPQTESTRRAK